MGKVQSKRVKHIKATIFGMPLCKVEPHKILLKKEKKLSYVLLSLSLSIFRFSFDAIESSEHFQFCMQKPFPILWLRRINVNETSQHVIVLDI